MTSRSTSPGMAIARAHFAPHWPWFLLGGVFAALSALAAWGYGLAFRDAFDAIGGASRIDPVRLLRDLPLMVIGLVLLRAVALYVQTQANNTGVQRGLVGLQDRLFDRLVSGDFSRLQNTASGEFVSQFINDLNLVREAGLRVATNFAKSLLTIVAAVVGMLMVDWAITLLLCVAYPIAFTPVVRLGQRIRKSSARAQTQTGEVTSMLTETLQGARTIKAYALEPYVKDRAHLAFVERSALYLKVLRSKALVDPFLELVGGVALAGLIAFAGWRASTGAASVGDLAAIIAYIGIASPEVRALGTLNSALNEGEAAAERVMKVVDATSRVADGVRNLAPEVVRGEVSLQDVRFAYGEGVSVLDGLSLNAAAGATVAIVGRSGSGKSTIFNLLLRLHDPDAGRVTIDGVDVRDLRLSSLRRLTALVSQDAFLFDDTIRNNVRLSRPGATDAEIEAACQAAACDFLDRLPQGLDTRVGEGGRLLSGGQRQRVCLARAMLSGAPVLLLDEATSALDSESEARIQEALAAVRGKRTLILIAHRLATVRSADVIHVVDAGRVVESGSHDDLMARGGAYARLAAMQLA